MQKCGIPLSRYAAFFENCPLGHTPIGSVLFLLRRDLNSLRDGLPARVTSQKQLSVVFCEVKPPKARSVPSRENRGEGRRLCDGGGGRFRAPPGAGKARKKEWQPPQNASKTHFAMRDA